MEFVGNYVFNSGEEFTVWKGDKIYVSRIMMMCSNSKIPLMKEIHDRDMSKIFYRSMDIIRNNLISEPVLLEYEGMGLPFKVKTEEQQIDELIRYHPEMKEIIKKVKNNIIMNLPNVELDIHDTSFGEN